MHHPFYMLVAIRYKQKINVFLSKQYLKNGILLGAFIFFVLLMNGSRWIRKAISLFSVEIQNHLSDFVRTLFVLIGILSILIEMNIGDDLIYPAHYQIKGYLPFKKYQFLLSDLFSSLSNGWYFILIVFFMAVMVNIHPTLSFLQWFLLFIVILLFMVSITLIHYLIRIGFDYLIHNTHLNRFDKLIRAALLFSTIAAIGYLVSSDKWMIQKFILPGLLRNTPLILHADTLTKILQEQLNSNILICFLVMILSNFILFLFCYLLFHVIYCSHRQSSIRVEQKRNTLLVADKLASQLFKIDSSCWTAYIKEVVYLLRSNRTKGYFIMGLILSFCYCLWFYENDPSFKTYLVVICVAPTALSKEGFYIFSFEGKAVQSNFYMPVQGAHFFLLKNLSYFLFILTNLIGCALISYAFEKDSLNLFTMVTSLMIIPYFYFLYCIFIDYLVFKNPQKVEYDTIMSKSTNIGNNGILMAAFIALCIPIACIFLLIDESGMILVSMIILGLLSIYLYYRSLSFLSKNLLNKRVYFIREIKG